MKPSEQLDPPANTFTTETDLHETRWAALMRYLDRLHAEREQEREHRQELLTLLTRQHLIPAADRDYLEQANALEKAGFKIVREVMHNNQRRILVEPLAR